MYYFPDLDESTRLLMINELERDLELGLFYEPVSMQKSFIPTYKRILKVTFENGTVESLQNRISRNFFKEKDKSGKKIPENIKYFVAFSDFNRYYIRALLIRAVEYKKTLVVYRAKQVINERVESKRTINKVYQGEMQLKQLLSVVRDYKILFNSNVSLDILKPNSGLSLKLCK